MLKKKQKPKPTDFHEREMYTGNLYGRTRVRDDEIPDGLNRVAAAAGPD